MKKVLVIGFSLLMLAGCGSKEKNSSPSSTSQTTNGSELTIENYKNGSNIDTDSEGKVTLNGKFTPNKPIYILVTDTATNGNLEQWVKSGSDGKFDYTLTEMKPGQSAKLEITTDVTQDGDNVKVNPSPKVDYTLHISNPNENKLSDTELSNTNYDIKINSNEIIDGKYGSKILALNITFTNKTTSSTTPWMAVATTIRATQETDTSVLTLSGANGTFPDGYMPELVARGDESIKPNVPVEAVVGFTIQEVGSPVKLIDFNMTDTATTFEKIIPTN